MSVGFPKLSSQQDSNSYSYESFDFHVETVARVIRPCVLCCLNQYYRQCVRFQEYVSFLGNYLYVYHHVVV